MKYALNLAADGRILSATYEQYAPADAVLVDELPTGETEREQDIHNWRCQNGEYVYDPLPDPEPTEPQPSESSVWDELDAAYQEGVDSV